MLVNGFIYSLIRINVFVSRLLALSSLEGNNSPVSSQYFELAWLRLRNFNGGGPRKAIISAKRWASECFFSGSSHQTYGDLRTNPISIAGQHFLQPVDYGKEWT
jgi:hypothetical protein